MLFTEDELSSIHDMATERANAMRGYMDGEAYYRALANKADMLHGDAVRARYSKRRFLITETDGDEPGFWSNAHGWTSQDEADRFTEHERDTLRLPEGGHWIEEVAAS